MLSVHWGTIFDNTSPFVAIRSLRYDIWSYPSIWYYQVTEVQYLILTLHLVLSGHWGTIFDNTCPFVAIRSLRYNIWSYPFIWYYQVTEVQYLILTLHLVLSGHWGTLQYLRYNIWQYIHLSHQVLWYNIFIPLHLVLSGHWGTLQYLINIYPTSPFGTIRSLRYNIWQYISICYYQVTEVNIWPYLFIWFYQVTEVQYLIIPLHLLLSGPWGMIFDHTPPFAIRSLRYLNIWGHTYSYPSIWYSGQVQLVLRYHIFDHTSPFGAIRSLRYNICTIFDNTCPFVAISEV